MTVRWRMENSSLKAVRPVFVLLAFSLVLTISSGVTDVQDVYAINSLYVALGSPPLPGWVPSGGDPCGQGWQGVQCAGPNMTSIILNAANLGGQLGDALWNFTTLITMDLSNNHIGGSIPENLPPHLQRLFLSANQFTGSIPGSIGELSLLTDMSLNNNLLTGQIPGVFQTLVGLINLDLSSNNLSGQLPVSFGNLLALTTLHLQNNQLTGTLNVLEDLKLQDLNIENNLFSGPVPPQMVNNIPIFRRDGNPFNVTPLSSPPGSPPSVSEPPTYQANPGSAAGPSQNISQTINSNRSSASTFFNTRWIVGLVFAVFIAIVIVILVICKCASWFRGRHTVVNRVDKRNEEVSYEEPEKKHQKNENVKQPRSDIVKVSNEAVATRTMNHEIDIGGIDVNLEPPPVDIAVTRRDGAAKHARVPESEKQNYHVSVVASNTDMGLQMSMKPKPRRPLLPVPDAVSFTISDLQQFTHSFGQENLIGEGSLGSVYLAELPDGKLLAVKKLDTVSPLLHMDEEFLQLVSSVSKLHHENITKLVGYSAEHGQRILVYEYCSNGTLYDTLHPTERDNKILSWSSRIKLALGAAQALEYLHEVCQPPMVHRNFKSANVLLDDDFSAQLSDCGLGFLFSSCCASQVSAHVIGSFIYGAPEYTMSGIYNAQSDVYSFGVVMLELLTGRKPLDRTRPRAEQSLVRWATPQLHDIDALSRMVDPALEGVYSVKSLSRFADIISSCLQPEPEFRPPMTEIVQSLLRMTQRQPAP